MKKLVAEKPFMECQGYRLPDGRLLAACSDGYSFMAMAAKDGGPRRRYSARMLPIRKTIEEAQADLEKYAQAKGLEAVRVLLCTIDTANQVRAR